VFIEALTGETSRPAIEPRNCANTGCRRSDDYGKKSIFGKDKGKEAEQKFTAALVLAVIALKRIGKIRDSKNAEESFTSLQNARPS
jgi:hypothetical protein